MVVLKSTNELCVVLCDLRSCYNVGSFFRTCDCFNASPLYLCGTTPHPGVSLQIRNKIDKTALGTIETVQWAYDPKPSLVVWELKRKGYQIIAFEHPYPNSVNLLEINYQPPVALLFGAEVEGLPQKILEAADIIAHIPIIGSKSSLNVASAGAIAIYQARMKLK